MKQIFRLAVAVGLAALPVAAAADSAASPAYAITDVSVVDVVRGALRPHQTVLVRDGKIAAITPAGRKPPKGYEVVDGRGKYLAPGFIDMHAHLNYRLQTRIIAPLLAPSDDDLLSANQLSLFTYNGVTTIQVMHGDRNMLAVRDQIEKGAVTGPRLVVGSPRLDGYPLPDPLVRLVIGRAEGVAVVDELKATGYDFIKVYDQLDEETYNAIVERAHQDGLRVDGHLPRTLPLAEALDHKQDHVAHIEEFVGYAGKGTDAEIARLAAQMKASGVGVTPTLIVFKNVVRSANDLPALLAEPETGFADPIVYRSWLPDENPYRAERFRSPRVREALARQYDLMKRLTLAFARAGVPLSAGTDCTISGAVCGFALHEEMAELAGLGLTPAEVLRMATINAATAMGKGGELGTVEAGKAADLVLLDADPLTNIANTQRIGGVFLRGRYLPHAALRARLAEALTAFAPLDKRLGLTVHRPAVP